MQFQVQYNANDTNNNVAIPLNRSILVLEDSVPPSIAINGVTPVAIELGSVFEDPGAFATDEVIILSGVGSLSSDQRVKLRMSNDWCYSYPPGWGEKNQPFCAVYIDGQR